MHCHLCNSRDKSRQPGETPTCDCHENVLMQTRHPPYTLHGKLKSARNNQLHVQGPLKTVKMRSHPATSHSLNLPLLICRRHRPLQVNCVIAGKELFTFQIMLSINLGQFVREQICSNYTSLKSSLIPIIATAVQPRCSRTLVPHHRASLIITDRTMRAEAGRWPEQMQPHRSVCTCRAQVLRVWGIIKNPAPVQECHPLESLKTTTCRNLGVVELHKPKQLAM